MLRRESTASSKRFNVSITVVLSLIFIVVLYFVTYSFYESLLWVDSVNTNINVDPSPYIHGSMSFDDVPSMVSYAQNKPVAKPTTIRPISPSSLSTESVTTPLPQDKFNVALLMPVSSGPFSEYAPVVFHPLLSSVSSILSTCSAEYTYTVYIGFNYEDKLFDFDERRKELMSYLADILETNLSPDGSVSAANARCRVDIHLLPIHFATSSLHRYNYLAQRAYVDGADFFLPIHAYAHMSTPGWAKSLIDNFHHGNVQTSTSKDGTQIHTIRPLSELHTSLVQDKETAAGIVGNGSSRVWPYFGAVCLNTRESNLENIPLYCMVSRIHLELQRGYLFASSALPHIGTSMRALYLIYTPFSAAKTVTSAEVTLGYGSSSRSCALPVYKYLVDDAFALNARKNNNPCRDFPNALLFRAKPWLYKGKFDHYTDGTPREVGMVSPSSSIVGPFEADLLARDYTADVIDNEVKELINIEAESLRRTESSEFVKKIVLKQRKSLQRYLNSILYNNGVGSSNVDKMGKHIEQVTDCLMFSEFCQ